MSVDIDFAKGFNKDGSLTTITCFVLDFDNSDNASIALKVFDSLVKDLIWRVDDVIDSSKRRFDSGPNKISRLDDARSSRVWVAFS